MKNHSNRLFKRLAVPLVGLLVTSHLLLPDNRTEATASKNSRVERLVLSERDGVKILQENVYSIDQLFDHNFFQDRFENRQVWAFFQMLRVEDQTVCLHFVDFRTQEDAIWAMHRLVESPSRFLTRKCQVFGTVLTYVQGPPDVPVGVLDGILQSVHAEGN